MNSITDVGPGRPASGDFISGKTPGLILFINFDKHYQQMNRNFGVILQKVLFLNG